LLLRYRWLLLDWWGSLSALALLLVTLLPRQLSASSRVQPLLYWIAALWAFAGSAALALSLLALSYPPSGCPDSVGCALVCASYVACGLTPALALVWLRFCYLQVTAFRAPLVAVELKRVVVIASTPAALIGWWGLGLEEEFKQIPSIPFLLLPTHVAATGTLIGACLLGAARLRLAAEEPTATLELCDLCDLCGEHQADRAPLPHTRPSSPGALKDQRQPFLIPDSNSNSNSN